MKCEDCKFWAKWLFSKVYGDCSNKSIGNFSPADDEELGVNTDILTSGAGGENTFVAGKDFGCIHAEEKKKTDTEDHVESPA